MNSNNVTALNFKKINKKNHLVVTDYIIRFQKLSICNKSTLHFKILIIRLQLLFMDYMITYSRNGSKLA